MVLLKQKAASSNLDDLGTDLFSLFIFVNLMCRMQPSVWEAPIDKLVELKKALNEESIPLDGIDSKGLGIEESIIFGIDSQP